MAEYLEKVQWRVRPPGAVDGPMLGEPLPIRHEDFTDAEVAIIVNKCRQGKAPDPDDIPAEYYQVVAKDPQIL